MEKVQINISDFKNLYQTYVDLNEVYSSEVENQKQDMEHSTSYYVFSTPLMK